MAEAILFGEGVFRCPLANLSSRWSPTSRPQRCEFGKEAKGLALEGLLCNGGASVCLHTVTASRDSQVQELATLSMLQQPSRGRQCWQG